MSSLPVLPPFNQSQILRELAKFPQKSMGQNFLTDPRALGDIIDAAELKSEDVAVEIGPGLGILTRELARRVKRVIAVELDRDLADHLRNQNIPNVTVISGDALRIEWDLTIEGPYKIVANIPYSITSPLLRKIYQLKNRPQSVVLLVQKEVAERLLAPPGSSERGYLTLLGEANAEISKVRLVKPGSFYPQPKVDSAIIKISPLAKPRINELFWPAVEAGFRHKRQTAANAISKDLHISKSAIEAELRKLGLDPLARPSVLSFDQWAVLSKTVQELVIKE